MNCKRVACTVCVSLTVESQLVCCRLFADSRPHRSDVRFTKPTCNVGSFISDGQRCTLGSLSSGRNTTLVAFLERYGTLTLEDSATTNAYLVDDLTQRACELSGITPVYGYLVALYDLSERAFLSSNQIIRADGGKHDLQLRVQFHPISTVGLLEDRILDYYYNQLLDYIFNEFELKERKPELVSHLIELAATDYVKQLVEKNEEPSAEKTSDFLSSVKLPANRKFPWWKKKAVEKYFVQNVPRCYFVCKRNLRSIEASFIDGVWEVLFKSPQEHFKARVVPSGLPYEVEIIVEHLFYGTEEAKKGPCIKIFQERTPGDIFSITHMCYINVINDHFVEVNVRDELPITLGIEKKKLIELVTLIDCYYWMTGRFGSLYMKKQEIHAPIRQSMAELNSLE